MTDFVQRWMVRPLEKPAANKVLWMVWDALVCAHLIEQPSNLELVGSRFDHRVQRLCSCNPRTSWTNLNIARSVWNGTLSNMVMRNSTHATLVTAPSRQPTFAADAHVGDAGGEVAEQPDAAAGDAVDAGGVGVRHAAAAEVRKRILPPDIVHCDKAADVGT